MVPLSKNVFGTFLRLREKLTEQLVSIHGVRDARVTVNLPEKARFSEATGTTSASVILHYEPDFAVSTAIPKVKTLIASSVQDLDYEKVSVVSFPAKMTSAMAGPDQQDGVLSDPLGAAVGSVQIPPALSRTFATLPARIVLGLAVFICLLLALRAFGSGRKTRGL